MQGTNPLQIYAWLLMEIWSPQKSRTKRNKLFYKTKGIVLYDQAMSEEWGRLDKPSYQHCFSAIIVYFNELVRSPRYGNLKRFKGLKAQCN